MVVRRPMTPLALPLVAILVLPAGCGSEEEEVTAPEIVTTSVDDLDVVPRTAWIELEFAATPSQVDIDGTSLRCGSDVEIRVTPLDEFRLIINPRGELPPASRCQLSIGGRRVIFDVAAEGDDSTIPYDRSDNQLATPFPDDLLLTPDPDTITGLRLAPLELGGAGASDLLPRLSEAAIYAGEPDGFSPVTPIVIDLPGAVDASTLPVDPGGHAASLAPLATLGLYDLDEDSPTHGEPISVAIVPRSEINKQGGKDWTLWVVPQRPLTAGGRYGFVLEKRALIDPTRPLMPSAFMRARLESGELDHLAGVLADRPVPRDLDDLALALEFTVRTNAVSPDDMLIMREQVFTGPVPTYQIEEVEEFDNPNDDVRAVVRGTWEAPNFLDGRVIARDDQGHPVQVGTRTTDFVLVLPRATSEGPVPVVQNLHSNPNNVNEALVGAQFGVAESGLAMLGTNDIIATEVTGGTDVLAYANDMIGTLVNDRRFPEYLGPAEWAEQLALTRLADSLAGEDFLPVDAPDGVPELDASARKSVVGFSAGAYSALGVATYAPEFALAVALSPTGQFSALVHHYWWELAYLRLAETYPDLSLGEFYVALGLIQLAADPQEATLHARYWLDEPVDLGDEGRPSVLITAGVSGNTEPNYSQHGLAAALGLQQLSPLVEIPVIEAISGSSASGNLTSERTGIYVHWSAGKVVEPSPGCEALTNDRACATDSPAAVAMQAKAFTTALTGVPVIDGPPTSP